MFLLHPTILESEQKISRPRLFQDSLAEQFLVYISQTLCLYLVFLLPGVAIPDMTFRSDLSENFSKERMIYDSDGGTQKPPRFSLIDVTLFLYSNVNTSYHPYSTMFDIFQYSYIPIFQSSHILLYIFIYFKAIPMTHHPFFVFHLYTFLLLKTRQRSILLMS